MADEPKWTPGPWAVCGDGKRVKPEPLDLFFAPIAETHQAIRWVDGNWQHQGGAEANAKLIAAAPDLYAALDDLLASYAEPDQQICCGGHGCGCRGASVRDLAEHHARAAIAKARGAA